MSKLATLVRALTSPSPGCRLRGIHPLPASGARVFWGDPLQAHQRPPLPACGERVGVRGRLRREPSIGISTAAWLCARPEECIRNGAGTLSSAMLLDDPRLLREAVPDGSRLIGLDV